RLQGDHRKCLEVGSVEIVVGIVPANWFGKVARENVAETGAPVVTIEKNVFLRNPDDGVVVLESEFHLLNVSRLSIGWRRPIHNLLHVLHTVELDDDLQLAASKVE